MLTQNLVRLPKVNVLLKIFWWELRGAFSNPLNWLAASVLFLFFVAFTWGTRNAASTSIESGGGSIGFNYSTFSGYGLIKTLPLLTLVLGFVLPLLSTGVVSKDLGRRTHELYMATAVPSYSYILGRYFVSLIMGLLATAMMLPAYLIGYLLFNDTQNLYHLDFGGLLTIWTAIALPACLILTNLSFVLGTWWPKIANPAKVIITGAWFLCYFLFSFLLPLITPIEKLVQSMQTWDPTHAKLPQFYDDFYVGKISTIGIDRNNYIEKTAEVRAILAQTPDLGSWIWPQLILSGLTFGLVAVVALRFHRYQKDL